MLFQQLDSLRNIKIEDDNVKLLTPSIALANCNQIKEKNNLLLPDSYGAGNNNSILLDPLQ